jgi:hypothetical protein
MILYPVAYVLVTLPLAAGRIASLTGNKLSLGYLLIGGSFMTSAGWIDCLLYSLTRSAFLTRNKSTVREVINRGQRYGRNSSTFNGNGVIELSARVNSPDNGYWTIPSPVGSIYHIARDVEDLGINKSHGWVKVETTWQVSTEYIGDEIQVDKGGYRSYFSAK